MAERAIQGHRQQQYDNEHGMSLPSRTGKRNPEMPNNVRSEAENTNAITGNRTKNTALIPMNTHFGRRLTLGTGACEAISCMVPTGQIYPQKDLQKRPVINKKIEGPVTPTMSGPPGPSPSPITSCWNCQG
ncbi:MAG: hypothetical protein NTV68_13545 [Methanomicrobiales archaeon]|nr:hypothetical protein [Methanomicrobiales archaeon]